MNICMVFRAVEYSIWFNVFTYNINDCAVADHNRADLTNIVLVIRRLYINKNKLAF